MNLVKKYPIASTIVFIILVSILISIIVILADSSRDHSSKLYLSVAPQDATILLDNELPLENNKNNSIKPGNHTLTISKEGYESQSYNLSLKKTEKKTITTALLPENNDFSVYETNYDNLYDLRIYLSENPDLTNVKNFLEKYDKQSEINNILPLYGDDPKNAYYVFYETNCKEKLYCLKIGASTDSAYSEALNSIKSHGFNPSDYEILRTN